MQRAKADTDAYIRQVAGKSPAEQIADAKALLDAGTIAPEEFQRLKAKAARLSPAATPHAAARTKRRPKAPFSLTPCRAISAARSA